MRLPTSSLVETPAPIASASKRFVSLFAAAVISSSSPLALPALAAPLPTPVELARLPEGLARIDQYASAAKGGSSAVNPPNYAAAIFSLAVVRNRFASALP